MITFSQLSVPLKIAIVASYVTGVLYSVAFLVGFLTALIS